MADADKNGAEKDCGLSAADANFLVICLQNANGGSISIDATAVGDVLGYKNARSVANRISLMKKKYNLPFGSGSSKGAASEGPGRKATDAATLDSPSTKVPATPSKNRVSKPRTPSTKKAVTPKTPKSSKGKAKGKADENNDAEESGEMSAGGPPQVGEQAVPVKESPDDEDRASVIGV